MIPFSSSAPFLPSTQLSLFFPSIVLQPSAFQIHSVFLLKSSREDIEGVAGSIESFSHLTRGASWPGSWASVGAGSESTWKFDKDHWTARRCITVKCAQALDIQSSQRQRSSSKSPSESKKEKTASPSTRAKSPSQHDLQTDRGGPTTCVCSSPPRSTWTACPRRPSTVRQKPAQRR